jgi:hypothetical protein
MTKRLYHCQPLHALYNLGAASEELRSDREFVLRLVRENGRILQYATKKCMLNFEGIENCFRTLESTVDEDYLAALSYQLKEKLCLHEAFVFFLCGCFSR